MIPAPKLGPHATSRKSASRIARANRITIDSLLFLSSFAPLFVLLAIRFSGLHLKAICAILAIIGTSGLLWVLKAAQRKTAEKITPIEIDDKGSDVSGYLATYLLPFLVLPDPSVSDEVAYAVFLIVAGVIYVRSRMLQINPTLYLLSYRVFAIARSDEGFRGYVIGRGEIGPGVPLRAARLRDNLLLRI